MRLLLILLSISILACHTDYPSEEEASETILELHNQQRVYHFEKQTEAFASLLSENFISANRGALDSLSYQEHVDRYNAYFGSVDFVKWDDVKPPIIRFSDDKTLAYTIVEKDVIVRYELQDGSFVHDSTRYAWTTIYKYNDREWKIESVASTNKESVQIPASE